MMMNEWIGNAWSMSDWNTNPDDEPLRIMCVLDDDEWMNWECMVNVWLKHKAWDYTALLSDPCFLPPNQSWTDLSFKKLPPLLFNPSMIQSRRRRPILQATSHWVERTFSSSKHSWKDGSSTQEVKTVVGFVYRSLHPVSTWAWKEFCVSHWRSH